MTGTGVLGHLLVEESQHVGEEALLRGMPVAKLAKIPIIHMDSSVDGLLETKR
jgi:hypothetical protein